MVCEKCGKELTQEMLDANLCWSCGNIIDPSKTENTTDDNSTLDTEQNEIINNDENTGLNTENNENTVGNILNFLGILILILGTFGSFAMSGGDGRYYSFTFSVFAVYEFATILSGFIVIGIAQIIQLLHKINNKLK